MIFKNKITYILIGLSFAFRLNAQVLSDTKGIPFDITLSQILRVSITGGGNIEFVFNSMSQYKTGIFNSNFYNTDVVIASSTDWELNFGAEDAVLLPTDDPAHGAQFPVAIIGIPLNNIGFMITSTGTNAIASGGATPTGLGDDSDVSPNGLGQFGVTASQNPLMSAALGTGNNGGDITDNAFTINWECGLGLATGAGNPTNGASLLSQNIQPDRYVTNILIDVNAL